MEKETKGQTVGQTKRICTNKQRGNNQVKNGKANKLNLNKVLKIMNEDAKKRCLNSQFTCARKST